MQLHGILSAAALVAALAASPVLAQDGGGGPSTIPNGPYGDNDSIASLRTYDQLVGALVQIVHSSRGAATLHYAPYTSNTGRGVPYVVVGDGPTAALIIAQQHGDEMETSDSAVALARTLSNTSRASKAIRAALTVVIVPRVNVDGFDGVNPDGTPIADTNGNTTPWRQNYDPRFVVGSLPAFYLRGRGYDINRYHAFRPECPFDNPNYPNLTTGVISCETVDYSPGLGVPYDFRLGNPVPEAKNVRQLNDLFRPVIALDMHHQGTRVHDGNMVTASTLWPTAVATANRLEAVEPGARARFDAGVDMAKRVVVIIAKKLAKYPYADLSRYPGGTEPGISRNAYGLLGSGSVLLELRGGLGTKSGGYIQKIGYHASLAIVETLAADPTLSSIDPNEAEILVVPANGVRPSPGNEEADVLVEGEHATPVPDNHDDLHLGN